MSSVVGCSVRALIGALLAIGSTPMLLGVQAEQFDITFYRMRQKTEFTDSVENDALQAACASDRLTLSKFFDQHEVPFSDELVFQMQQRTCHIWYQPTVEGFRASPDDWPISHLLFDLHTLSVITKREEQLGDTVDIARRILPLVQSEIELFLGVRYQDAQEFAWVQAGAHHYFPMVNFSLRNNSAFHTPIWSQDLFESGVAEGKTVLLLPRHLFEGVVEGADVNRSVLASIPAEYSYRSKLSFDGGDLLFASHPEDPRKLVLLYGWASWLYWGRNMSRGEYEYVLKREFGADLAIEISDPLSHVDYLVSLIPKHKIALVARPVRGNLDLVRDAIRLVEIELRETSSTNLEELSNLIETHFAEPSPTSQAAIFDLISRIRPKVSPTDSPKGPAPTLQECQRDPMRCFSEGFVKVYLEDFEPQVKEWTFRKLQEEIDKNLIDVLYEIIASQVRSDQSAADVRSRQAGESLAKSGFRVLYVPRIGGDPEATYFWPGISIANSLLVGDRLFVPHMGLGPSEQRLLEDLQKELPDDIQIVPIYARHALCYNGGIHCVSGIVRKPPAGGGDPLMFPRARRRG